MNASPVLKLGAIGIATASLAAGLDHRRTRSDRRCAACRELMYKDVDYTGRGFCAAPAQVS
jgi:hypothetical protein